MSLGEETTRTIAPPFEADSPGVSSTENLGFQPLAPEALAESALPPTVWLLDEPQCPEYDAFVRQFAGGTFYHSLTWQAVLHAMGLGQPLYLAAMLGDEVAGALPLFELTDQEGQRRLVSLPGTPVAGPLASDVACRWLLHSRALSLNELRGDSGLFVRAWQPLESAGAAAAAEWLRLPIAALLGGIGRAADGDENAQVVHGPLDGPTRRALRHLAVGPIATTLAQDEALATELQFTGEVSASGNPQAGVAWCTHADYVHVVAWYEAVADVAVAARLLRCVAARGAAHGATHIDFPGLEGAVGQWAAERAAREMQFSVESPLTSAAALPC